MSYVVSASCSILCGESVVQYPPLLEQRIHQLSTITKDVSPCVDRGMTVTAGSVKLEKNESNLIGISIGGGGKYCPCLYVVQVRGGGWFLLCGVVGGWSCGMCLGGAVGACLGEGWWWVGL